MMIITCKKNIESNNKTYHVLFLACVHEYLLE